MFAYGPNKKLGRQGGSRSLGRERGRCASEQQKDLIEKGGSLGQGHGDANGGTRHSPEGWGAGWGDRSVLKKGTPLPAIPGGVRQGTSGVSLLL